MPVNARSVPRPLRGSVAAATLAFIVLAAPACSEDKAETVPKGPFIEAATKICQDSRAEIDAERDKATAGEIEIAEFIEFASGAVVEQIDAIRKLGLPTEERARLEQSLSTYEAIFTTWRENPGAAGQGADDPAFLAAAEFLNSYGLEACGTDV